MKNKIQQLRAFLLDYVQKSSSPVLRSAKVKKIIEAFLTVSFIRYLIIGFSTFGLDALVFKIIYIAFPNVMQLLINICSTAVAMVYNFSLSNFWTFQAGKGNTGKKLAKYLALAAFNYLFNNFAFYILNEKIGLHWFITKVIVTGIIISWNFLLYRFWVFRK